MNPNHPTRIDGRIFPTPPSAATPFPLKEGIKVIHTTLTAGQTYKVSFSTPNLMNITIRIANSTQLSANTTLKVYFHNYKTMNTVYYTLNTNRYGVFIDNKPLDYIIFENLDEILTIDIYMEYLIKSYHDPFQEEVQFITVIQELPPPPSTQLFQGTNNRYNGTLADATFFGSVPLGTNMAVRQINSESSSTTEIGIVEIPLAANMTYHANLAPTSYIQYGQNSTSEIVVFTSDSVTQQLPSSATQSYATTNQIIVDYQFDYNLSVAFSSGYTISTSGTTTSISFSGNANAYYYSNPSLYFANASLSLSESESQYTLSPTSGTTNSSGKLPFTFSETLNSTATLPANDITVSADIAGISKTSSSTLTPNFNYTMTSSLESTDNPTSGNYGNVTYTSDTTLTGNINAINITINSGVTITTNGYYMYAISDFTNNGTLTGGNNSNAPGGTAGTTTSYNGGAGTSITTSYAGSAGGGGGGGITSGGEPGGGGGSGGSTLVAGGSGGSGSDTIAGGGGGGAGSTPSAPSMSQTLASDMFSSIEDYLSSASGGGGGAGGSDGGAGGAGIFGVAIGGNNVIAGTINTNGNSGDNGNGGDGNGGSGGGGGSGAGSILIVYNSSYTAGTYSYSGGSGGSGGAGTNNGGSGGNGGNGQLITYQTSTPPISTFSITSTYTITATYNSQTIPNQTISLKITGTGSASFSSSSTVTSTTATTDSSGQVTVTIYSINSSDNTLTASATVAGITNSASITI